MLQPPYKVDLKKPEKTLIVQLIKSVAAVSVVSNYWQLQKFNIRELCMSDEERAAKEADKEVCSTALCVEGRKDVIASSV